MRVCSLHYRRIHTCLHALCVVLCMDVADLCFFSRTLAVCRTTVANNDELELEEQLSPLERIER